MRNLLRVGMLLILAGVPAYRWATPNLPKLKVRPFDERDWKRFQQMDIERATEARNRAKVERIFDSCSETADGLVESVLRYASVQHIPPHIVAATVVAESSCRSNVVSSAGAMGLMQVNPHIWRYKRAELMNPDRNLEVGTKILAGYVRESGSVRNGLRHYFGISPESDASDEYADRVLEISRRR